MHGSYELCVVFCNAVKWSSFGLRISDLVVSEEGVGTVILRHTHTHELARPDICVLVLAKNMFLGAGAGHASAAASQHGFTGCSLAVNQGNAR